MIDRRQFSLGAAFATLASCTRAPLDFASTPVSAGYAHLNDQAEHYATGNLRPVYFYPEDVAAHVKRRYHPGEGVPRSGNVIGRVRQ